MMRLVIPTLLFLFHIQLLLYCVIKISFYLEYFFPTKKNVQHTCNKLTPAESQQFSINEDC